MTTSGAVVGGAGPRHADARPAPVSRSSLVVTWTPPVGTQVGEAAEVEPVHRRIVNRAASYFQPAKHLLDRLGRAVKPDHVQAGQVAQRPHATDLHDHRDRKSTRLNS